MPLHALIADRAEYVRNVSKNCARHARMCRSEIALRGSAVSAGAAWAKRNEDLEREKDNA